MAAAKLSNLRVHSHTAAKSFDLDTLRLSPSAMSQAEHRLNNFDISSSDPSKLCTDLGIST